MKKTSKCVLAKLTLISATLFILGGCTGTTYNKAKDCSTDYLIHPAISIPSVIGACDASGK